MQSRLPDVLIGRIVGLLAIAIAALLLWSGLDWAAADPSRWSAEQLHGADPGQIIAAERVHGGLHVRVA